jgi:hypothetical protein
MANGREGNKVDEEEAHDTTPLECIETCGFGNGEKPGWDNEWPFQKEP